MEKNQARKLIEKYLQEKGINPNNNFICLNPSHKENNPSMGFYRKKDAVHCFGCGAYYDIFNLVEMDTGITNFKEQLDYLEKWAEGKIKLEKISPQVIPSSNEEEEAEEESQVDYIFKMASNIKNTDYMEKRGIDKKILEKYLVGYDPKFYAGRRGTWQAVIFPTSATSYVARNTATGIEKGDRVFKKGKVHFFNYSALINPKVNRPVYVVEGEVDCLSILQVGGECVALGGTSNVEEFLRTIKEKKIKKDFIIALDNDEVGIEASKKLTAGLSKLRCKFRGVDLNILYQGGKDANDSLLINKGRFMELVEQYEEIIIKELEEERSQEVEAYLNEISTLRYLKDFANNLGNVNQDDCIKTGFPKLDKILDGGLYPGLHIIGAISSLGKTTLVTQIADQIAKRGTDVLIFSLEMARTELMAKSISRQTLINTLYGDNKRTEDTPKFAKTLRQITSGTRYKYYSKEEIESIKQAVRDYGEIAKNLYIYEGIGDIGIEQVTEILKKHIEITKKKPLLVIDYIQILAPYDVRATDKANIDKAVLELKRLSRDFGIPVLGISSFNRDSYSGKVSMKSFKESGAIEYGSDVLIGLQLKGADDKNFDVDEAKKKDPREVELVILKQRNGGVFEKDDFKYFPKYNYFQEV